MSAAWRLPSPLAPRGPQPRRVSEGTVPLVAVEGSAYDCGRWYGEMVRERYPSYDRYLSQVDGWHGRSGVGWRLVERAAPHLVDVYRGLADSARGEPDGTAPRRRRGAARTTSVAAVRHHAADGCTSFGVHGSVALDGQPVSGQTKDVDCGAAPLFLVLRMRIVGAPTILVLAYPGEVLGHGSWSTGVSLFRNSVYSRARARTGLTLQEWGFLTLAGTSVHEGVELARRHGIVGAGSCLISDGQGESLSVEFNAGGVSVVPARDGIATHANHPEGAETAPFADPTWAASERENSGYRMHGLWRLLDAERGRLTAQRAMMLLADHTYYPQGICRHWVEGAPREETAAAVVAQPTIGRLHVVRGQPCANWGVTYTL